MKIYDPAPKRVLSEVTLYLTPAEASELASAAETLAADPQHHHSHVSSQNDQTEITIAVYTAENLHQFDSESQAILGDNGHQ